MPSGMETFILRLLGDNPRLYKPWLGKDLASDEIKGRQSSGN
jgi:hypothetical protein